MSSSRAPDSAERPPTSDYIAVVVILVATVALLVRITWGTETGTPPAGALIPPVVTLVGLTGLVLLLTAFVRNLAVFRGSASPRYYLDYVSDPPSERLERPARAFNNLLQVPMLFYAVCALMIASGHVDGVQVALAWLYVGARALHAAIYILFNRLAYRFSVYIASCIVLGVLWARFASQSWPAG